MAGLYTHTSRPDGTTLTSAIYDADHQNHINNATPQMHDDYSTNQAQMRAQADPGEIGSETFATSLAGELERLRFAITECKRKTYWYETPDKFTSNYVLFSGTAPTVPLVELLSVGVIAYAMYISTLNELTFAVSDGLGAPTSVIGRMNSTGSTWLGRTDSSGGRVQILGPTPLLEFHLPSVVAYANYIPGGGVNDLHWWRSNGNFGATSQLMVLTTTGALNTVGLVNGVSDERFKTNWRSVPENFIARMATIKKNGLFDWTDRDEVDCIGTGAQSLQRVFPQAVSRMTEVKDKRKSKLLVAHGAAALVTAIELCKEVEIMKKALKAMRKELDRLK